MTRLRGGEFIHVGDLCTFEVLVKSFGFKDKTVRKIAEIIHDLDIKDERYGSPEAKGLEDVLIGIRKTAKSDADALERGIAVFGRGTRYIIRRRACGRSLQGKTLRHCHGDLWHDFRYRACIRSHSRRISPGTPRLSLLILGDVCSSGDISAAIYHDCECRKKCIDSSYYWVWRG